MFRRIATMLPSLALIAAATLKSAEFARGPLGFANPQEFAFLFQIAVESFLGVALLVPGPSRSLMRFAMWLFVVFSCYALGLVVLGKENCGCFGQIKVSPIAVLFGDCFFVAILYLASKMEVKQVRPAIRFSGTIAGAVLAIVLSIWAVSFVPSELDTENLSGTGKIFELSRRILEKDRDFDFLGVAQDCDKLDAEGQIVVVLFRHDCTDCLKKIHLYEHLSVLLEQSGDAKLAFVEVPPYSKEKAFRVRPNRAIIWCGLRPEHRWFVQTPLTLILKKGKISWIAPKEFSVQDIVDHLRNDYKSDR